ncbi:O-glycosyl hydrolase family 30 protein [Aphelenchoides avenae]|nr:O-glycosyl hydrolase family 30 protein [Aphelenchus avenae]
MVDTALASRECATRAYPTGVVCVCNATYCDDFPEIGDVRSGQVAVVTSSKSGKRFARSNVEFTDGNEVTALEVIRVKIDASRSYQQIFGFGGAFTDAAGIQLKRLSDAAQEQLLRTYYAPEGIEYSMGRVPIASTDFSTREYSYLDEPNDFELEAFNLAMETMS